MNHPQWVDAMAHLMQRKEYFRWFDTGDLQSVEQLGKIAAVCERTPDCHHWLSTREAEMVRQYLVHHELPENLNIRISTDMVNAAPGRMTQIPSCTTSTVSSGCIAGSHNCPVTTQADGPKRCQEAGCRACWRKEVANVNYGLH